MKIRPAKDSDRDAIWEIFWEVIAAGETYPIDPNIPREEALAYWFKHSAHVCVAESENGIVGSYTLHQNQAAGGAHVANAAFIVAKTARDGRALFERSAPARISRDAIQFRGFDQRIGGETLAGSWNENCGHFTGRVSASRKRRCRCLRDVSLLVARELRE